MTTANAISIAREALSPESAEAIEAIMNAPKGGFMSIRNFRPKYGKGEVKDITFCKGISYANAVSKSLEELEKIEADENFSIEVKFGAWADANGNVTPTARKSKAYPNFTTITKVFKRGDGDMELALEGLRKSLTSPAPASKEYEKVGNGVYRDEDGNIHVRDLRKVSQKVHVKGDYPNKASKPHVAIKDALKKDMPVGHYRQFRLDGDYDMVRAGGEEIAHQIEEETEV